MFLFSLAVAIGNEFDDERKGLFCYFFKTLNSEIKIVQNYFGI